MPSSTLRPIGSFGEVVSFAKWDEFLASSVSFIAQFPHVAPMDTVMIQNTSGITGFSKCA